MSELTSCNFCSYERLKRRYGENNVRIVPKVYELQAWQVAEVFRNEVWEEAASFLVLTAHCVC